MLFYKTLNVLNTNQMQKSERKNIKNWANYHQKTIFRAAILDFGHHQSECKNQNEQIKVFTEKSAANKFLGSHLGFMTLF
jgi:hypothetical protein